MLTVVMLSGTTLGALYRSMTGKGKLKFWMFGIWSLFIEILRIPLSSFRFDPPKLFQILNLKEVNTLNINYLHLFLCHPVVIGALGEGLGVKPSVSYG